MRGLEDAWVPLIFLNRFYEFTFERMVWWIENEKVLYGYGQWIMK